MPVINIAGFSGSNQAIHPRLLAETVGVSMVNAEPGLNELRPIKEPLQFATVPTSPQRKTIVGMGRDSNNRPQYFLGWANNVSVTAGFDGGDTTLRLYYSGDGAPKWTNNDIGLTGGPPYPQASRLLSVPAPISACTGTVATAGTGTEADRFYVYTYVNDIGWESAPSPTFEIQGCKDGSVVNLGSFPGSAPSGAYGINRVRIYRTQSGTNGAAEFYFLREIAIGTTTTVDDARALGELLPTEGWIPPPDDGFGLTALWSSMFAILSGKAVRFCEPGFLYAYPLKYEILLKDKPVAQATWEQNLVIATEGRPVLIQGQDPAGMTDTRLALSHPCLSAPSMCSIGHGVVWASNDGLAYVGTNGQALTTKDVITVETWRAMKPQTMVVGRWKTFAVVSYESGSSRLAFMIDPLRPAVGVVHLTFGFDACWYDELQDDLYILQAGNIKRFAGGSANLTATFTSKVFRQASAKNYAKAEVIASQYPVALTVTSSVYEPVSGTHVDHVTSKSVTGPDPVSLPSGFVSEDWQIGVESTGNVQGVRLATSARLLRG